SLLGVALTPWILMGATWLLVGAASRLWTFGRQQYAVLLLCMGMCNSSFLGYPMVRASGRGGGAVRGGLRPVRHLHAAVHGGPVPVRALQRRRPPGGGRDRRADRALPAGMGAA